MKRDLRTLSNEELVGRAFLILVSELEPFVARNVGASWSEYSRDSSGILSAMHSQWNSVFGKVLEPVARSWVLESATRGIVGPTRKGFRNGMHTVSSRPLRASSDPLDSISTPCKV